MTEPYVIEISKTGGPEVLQRVARGPRQQAAGEALVRQEAVGLNFIDTYHRTGLYPVKLPFVPGSEGAGVIEAVGEGVDHLKVGMRVAYLGAGTYGSYYTGPAARMVALPEGVSCADGAAVLLKGLTAWMLLFEVRRASPGETALVWAPVGGVGNLLVPWARALGMRVIAVTSSAEKADRARAIGANDVVMSGGDVAAQVRELTDGAGVDVSYDSVGKVSAAATLESLKPRGWWVSYGNASGAVEPLSPGILAMKGSLVLTRPTLFSFIADAEGLRKGSAALFGAMASGTLKPHVGQKFALSDVAEAHRAIESGKTVGATLLLP